MLTPKCDVLTVNMSTIHAPRSRIWVLRCLVRRYVLYLGVFMFLEVSLGGLFPWAIERNVPTVPEIRQHTGNGVLLIFDSLSDALRQLIHNVFNLPTAISTFPVHPPRSSGTCQTKDSISKLVHSGIVFVSDRFGHDVGSNWNHKITKRNIDSFLICGFYPPPIMS